LTFSRILGRRGAKPRGFIERKNHQRTRASSYDQMVTDLRQRLEGLAMELFPSEQHPLLAYRIYPRLNPGRKVCHGNNILNT
jgi:hypothetical protein